MDPQTSGGDAKDGETRYLLSSSGQVDSSSEELTSPGPDDAYDDDDNSTYGSTKHYSIYTAIIYLVNYTIGSGILGIPYEYNRAGYILGTVVLLWVGWLTYVSFKYVCNQMLRAEAITTIAVRYGLRKSEFIDNPSQITDNLRDNVTLGDFQNEMQELNRNEYELNHIVGLFCGKTWRIIYEVSFIINEITALWSYMVLFGASLARIGGISSISTSCDVETEPNNYNCRLLYSFYICLFWIWCTFIVLLDFTEQRFVQFGSFFVRLLIVLLIVITSIGLMYGDLYYDNSSGRYYERSNDSTPYYGEGLSAWKWSGFMDYYAVATFAFTTQFCVPDTLQPLRINERRKNMTKIMQWSMIFMLALLILVGIIVSLYFGNQTESVCTLAWKYFIGFFWDDGDRPGWSYVIGYFIVLLPPVDMLGTFPLNIITTARTVKQSLCDLDRLHNDVNYERKWNVVTCLSTVAISAILSLCVVKFNFVLIFSGLTSFIALYFIPAYVEYKSREMCKIITNDVNGIETPVMGWDKSTFWIYATIVSSLIATIGVVADFF